MKWILILIPILIIGLVFVFNVGKKLNIIDEFEIEGTGGFKDYTNPNAPTSIESKEIVSFEYSFSTADLNYWGKRNIPYERCDFKLARQEDQVLYKGIGYGYYGAAFDFEIELPLSVLEGLNEAILTNKVVNSNGIYRKTIGIPEDNAARLRVEYASGETISAYDNSGHVMVHSATLGLYDFLVALAKSVDDKLVYTDEEFMAISSFLTGTFESSEGNTSLLFQMKALSMVEIYEDGYLVEDEHYVLKADKIYKSALAGDFSAYEYFQVDDDRLFGIQSDGSKVEFIKTE